MKVPAGGHGICRRRLVGGFTDTRRAKLPHVADPYPRYAHYPRSVAPPNWVGDVIDVFTACRTRVDTVTLPKGVSSDLVLEALRPGLQTLGFEVESGKGRY